MIDVFKIMKQCPVLSLYYFFYDLDKSISILILFTFSSI